MKVYLRLLTGKAWPKELALVLFSCCNVEAAIAFHISYGVSARFNTIIMPVSWSRTEAASHDEDEELTCTQEENVASTQRDSFLGDEGFDLVECNLVTTSRIVSVASRLCEIVVVDKNSTASNASITPRINTVDRRAWRVNVLLGHAMTR